MDRRNERGASTRSQVLQAATGLFASMGYEDVSIDLVLRESGVSKGALYHHFRSKEALFADVVEAVETRIVEEVASCATGAANPLDALRAGCGAWLDLVDRDEAVRRIAVIDAPAVLGWHAWRELEGRYALGLLRGALAAAASLGRLDPARVDAYAFMLLAILNEMAMRVARAPEREAAVSDARHAVELVISRLVGVAPGAPWPADPSEEPV